MPFDRPTLTTIVTRISGDFETRISGAVTLLRRSVLKVTSKVFGGAIHLLYGFLDYTAKNLFILTADEYGLTTHGSEYGLDREVAEFAGGSVQGTGTNGTVISAGDELQADDGQTYTTDEDVTIAAGIFEVEITAAIAGAAGNQDPVAVLSFVSPAAGVDATATVDSDALTGGADEEGVEDWRDRLLTRKRMPPHGGAAHDYETWAQEVPGVTRAWSFPLYMGDGTVGLAIARDDDVTPLPNAAELEDVYDYVIEHEDPATGQTVGIPVTAEPGFFVIGHNDGQIYGTKAIDFTLGIYPNTGAVQAALTEKLADVVREMGGPGETLYISDVYFMLGEAADLERLSISVPATDVTAATNELPIVGVVTFNDY